MGEHDVQVIVVKVFAGVPVFEASFFDFFIVGVVGKLLHNVLDDEAQFLVLADLGL
jgi:hypothetical protein